MKMDKKSCFVLEQRQLKRYNTEKKVLWEFQLNKLFTDFGRILKFFNSLNGGKVIDIKSVSEFFHRF